MPQLRHRGFYSCGTAAISLFLGHLIPPASVDGWLAGPFLAASYRAAARRRPRPFLHGLFQHGLFRDGLLPWCLFRGAVLGILLLLSR